MSLAKLSFNYFENTTVLFSLEKQYTCITKSYRVYFNCKCEYFFLPSDYRITHDPKYKERTIIVALVSVVSVAVVIAIAYLCYRLWLGSHKETLESAVHLIEPPSTPTFELDQLKLLSLIERGRYGEVWRGTLNDIDVAVKLYQPHQKLYYLNEKDLYMLPYMDHDAIPKFYGAEERIDPEGGYHYMIVMQYVNMGTVAHYLKENTIDWNIMCKMMHSAAAGLAHLHTDVIKGGMNNSSNDKLQIGFSLLYK